MSSLVQLMTVSYIPLALPLVVFRGAATCKKTRERERERENKKKKH